MRMTIAGWAAALAVIPALVGPSPSAAARQVPAPPGPGDPDEILLKKTAARLLAEMGPDTPIETKVARLIDRLVLRDRDQVQAAITALTMLGEPAVPAIIRRIDDRRDMPIGGISFENRAVDAFEGVRHYGVEEVVDALDDVLNDITGEIVGPAGGEPGPEASPARPGFAPRRQAIVDGWRRYLARRNATPPVPGKSLPAAP
jgi:hypothetical protein